MWGWGFSRMVLENAIATSKGTFGKSNSDCVKKKKKKKKGDKIACGS